MCKELININKLSENYFMKKIISAVLAATMLITAVAFSVGAAQISDNETSARQLRFEELSETTLPDNTIKTYTYGYTQENNPEPRATFYNRDTGYYYFIRPNADDLSTPNTKELPKGEYKFGIYGTHEYQRYNFEHTGGTYVLTRFKINDFSPMNFNEDGTQTRTFANGDTHNFNFVKESDGRYSQLAIISGGYVNFVAPDKDGYVQAYLFKKVGEKAYYFTKFEDEANSYRSGSIEICVSYDLVIGNVVSNVSMGTGGIIDILDATAIQSYIAGIEELDKIQIRNADVTGDRKIDVADVTMLQKYIADML